MALALGIGANTAVFSVVNAVLLRPLWYRDPGRLVMVWKKHPEGLRDTIMTREFRGLRDENRVFESLSAVQGFPMVLTRIGEPEQLEVLHVSASYFRTLGIDVAQGRTFLGDDEQPGRERVAVLGHDFWQRKLGGDPAVVGKTLGLDDQLYTVVGVLPPRAHDYLESQLWVPLVLERNPAVSVLVVARLKQDVSLQQAQAAMDVLAPRLNQRPGWGLNVVSMHEDFVGRLRPALLVLLGAVGLLLLIGCANVANLLLARAVARRREMGIRLALGASQGQLIRELLGESFPLAVLGGTAGLLLAFWGTRVSQLSFCPNGSRGPAKSASTSAYSVSRS